MVDQRIVGEAHIHRGGVVRVCAISFKECWRDDASGAWMSDGGFPLQMAAIASLFDEMVLVTAGGAPRGGGIALPSSVRVVPLPAPVGVDMRRKLSILAGLPRYVRAIAPELRRADAVHVPLPGDLPFIGMVMAQAWRKPLLARYGSSWAINGETTLMNRVTKRWMRLAAGGRNVMLATGEEDAPPAPRMHWIFASALRASELRALDPPLDRGLSTPPRLVYAGRLSPEKGVAVLLQALALLEANAGRSTPSSSTNASSRADASDSADASSSANGSLGTQPQLFIAGDGPARASLEAFASTRLPVGRVTFLGQLDRAALSRCLLDADMLVLPSLTEGFPKACLDALAHGLPVIASDVGATRALVGCGNERGMLVPAGDAATLAAAIARMLDEPRDWPALRRRCHDYARTRTLEAWADRAGRLCASQWKLALIDGKLREPHPCT
jgi:glycosyltransferase involved in cell wall biosynthesis